MFTENIVLIVLCSAVVGAVGMNAKAQPADSNQRLLFPAQDTEPKLDWLAVNDDVMGGVSQGTVRRADDGKLEFSGLLSLENNGGFASIRTRGPSLNLSEFESLIVRVRGDGRRYSFSVRTDLPVPAGAYYFDFDTREGEWQEIRMPFESFQVRSFGRTLPVAPRLNRSQVRSLGFIISDKKEGPFRLDVEWIKAVGSPREAAAVENAAGGGVHHAARGLIERAIARGAPLYNDGQAEACAAVYELTARCLVELSAHELPEAAVKSLREGLQMSEGRLDHRQRAWDLRHALDGALHSLMESD
jgi:monofunctional biosynthetic peptidoglycan transglycosylase